MVEYVIMQPEIPQDVSDLAHHYAGVFLITEFGDIIGHVRDDKPGIDAPGRVSTFGGTIEPEDESPLHGALRELVEETNLEVDPFEMRPLITTAGWRPLTEEWEGRHIFYLTIPDEAVSALEIYEGQGWTVITGPDDPRLVDDWREFVQLLREKLALA